MNSVIVVGGGVSGILSALLLREKYEHVYLIERAPKLGGLLSSVQSPEGDSFDYGTHYLVDTGQEKIDSLLFPPEWKQDWVYLPFLKAGNYFEGKLNERCMYPDVNLLPAELYQRGVEELLAIRSEPQTSANLEEYLSGTFGATFTKAVFEPILTARLGLPLAELHSNGHTLINLTRILAFDADITRKLKLEVQAYDKKIGFHSYLEGTRTSNSYYPKKGGTGAWIDLLESRMISAGVTVLKSKAVKAVHHSNGVVGSITFDSGENLECDAIFWTLPVSAFLKLCNLPGVIDPPQIRTTSHFHFVFDTAPNTDLYYLLCHDASKLSFRVTLYSNIQPDVAAQNGRYGVSVEVLSGQLGNIEEASQKILTELMEMEIFPENTKVLWKLGSSGVSGIPVITPKFVTQTQEQMQTLEGRLKNAYFLGMIPGVSFFKREVLMQSYEQISKLP